MDFPSSKSHNSEPLVLSHQRLAHNLPGHAAGVIRGHKLKSVSGKSLPVVPHDIIGHWYTLVFAWVPSERRCIYDLWHQWHICMNENKKWRYVLNGIKHDRHIYIIQWHNIDELNIIWYMLRSKFNKKMPKKNNKSPPENPPPLSATPRKTSSLLHGDIEPGRWCFHGLDETLINKMT